MVEVKRKRNETFDSLLRRFSKKIQMSGRVLQAKKIRFKIKAKSKNLRRQSALRRIEIRDHREYLKKIGKLPEEDMKKNNQRRSR